MSLPRPVVVFLFLLLAALPASFSAATGTEVGDAAPATGAYAPAGERKLTEREALILARILAGQGRRDEAVTLYRELMRRGRVREYRIEAAFQLAGIFMLEGSFRDAALLFQDILRMNPDLARVRLELARAYFLNGDYEDARLQFELLKGSGLPPEVQEKVDLFLTRIRRMKDWSVSLDLSLVPDSNINQASGGEEECIAFGGMLLCRPLDGEKGGMGLSAGGSFDQYLRFNRDFGLRNSVSVQALEYEQGSFDDYQLFLASGPRRTFEQGELSLQPTFRKRWYAGRQYSEEYGLRLDAQWSRQRFILAGELSWSAIRYADSYVDSFLRGNIFAVSTQARYILNDRTFVQAGLACQEDNTRSDAQSSTTWRYALGLYRILPFGLSFFGEMSFSPSTYHGSQWYITRDYRIDSLRRKDRTWQFFASLSSSSFEKYGITPTLQYVYTKRDSNIWTCAYTRHRLNMAFRYRF